MDSVLRMNEKSIEVLTSRVVKLKDLYDLFRADIVCAADSPAFQDFMSDERVRLDRENKGRDTSSILARRIPIYAQLIEAQLEAGQILDRRIRVLRKSFNYYAHGCFEGHVAAAVQDVETQYQDLATRFTLANAYQSWIKKFEISGSSVGVAMNKPVSDLFDVYSEANLDRSVRQLTVDAGELLLPLSEKERSDFMRDFLETTNAASLSNFYLSDFECRLGEVLLSDIEMIRQAMYPEYTEKALALSGAKDVIQYELEGVALALQRAQGHLVLGHKYQDFADKFEKLEHLHL